MTRAASTTTPDPAALRRLLRLRCGVQHYAWGDDTFIPALLGIDNVGREPFAELWMGRTPDLPSMVELDGGEEPLDRLIGRAAPVMLGPEVAAAFGNRLPFLFKVLSAAAPLSIQTHPTREQARAGFARENAAGVGPGAPDRSYHDDNHKPELIVALTEFHALCGFRPLPEIARVLVEVPELATIAPGFLPEPESLRRTYEAIMTCPPEQVDAALDPLVRRLEAADRATPFGPRDREHWVLRADRLYSQDGHRDRGLLSIFLLNLVNLEPGEALFLPAGVLHSYLQGSGVEVMANSNNVLRGGLTHKHVDVPGLLASLEFTGQEVAILRAQPVDTGESIFRTPAREFQLRRVELGPDGVHEVDADHGVEILIVVDLSGDGRVTLTAGAQAMELERGGVCLVPRGLEYSIGTRAPATIYTATVPAPVG